MHALSAVAELVLFSVPLQFQIVVAFYAKERFLNHTRAELLVSYA